MSVRQLNEMLNMQLDLRVWLEEIKLGICLQTVLKALRMDGITKKMNIGHDALSVFLLPHWMLSSLLLLPLLLELLTPGFLKVQSLDIFPLLSMCLTALCSSVLFQSVTDCIGLLRVSTAF